MSSSRVGAWMVRCTAPWEWYRTDGSLMRTGAFDQGRQVGLWRTIDRTGRVVKETDFSKEGDRP